MRSLRKNWAFISVAVVSVVLGMLALLTALRLRQQGPLAPTAPTKQRAVEGSPVPECQDVLTVVVPSPTASPLPSPTATPIPGSTPSPTATASPTATPIPTATPVATPIPTATPVATPIPTAAPAATVSPAPTATPPIDLQCPLVSAYRLTGTDVTNPASWHLLTASELANLQAGDVIYFMVSGPSQGSLATTLGRIRLTLGTNTPQPFTQADQATGMVTIGGVNQFYKSFTVPAGAFRIDGQVYSPQFDNDTDPWNSSSGWR